MSISSGLIDSFVLPESKLFFEITRLTGLNSEVRGLPMLLFILIAFVICLVPENNYRRKDKLNAGSLLLAALAFIWGILCLGSESVFVYFGF